MITARKLAIGVGALSALASVAHAQSSADASATGSATIIQPITASSPSNLGFGVIVKPAGATVATIAISNSGSRTVTNTVAVGGGATAASFQIVGEGGQAFSISMNPTFDMTTTGGSATLTVTADTAGYTGGSLSGSIGAPGTATFGVGGSFNLNSATVSGAYSGNIVVTASYN